MIPKTLSATSLSVADKCMSRWKAEFYEYARSVQGSAANVGIVLHGTNEDMLRAVFIKKQHGWDEEKYWEYFHVHSDTVLGPDRTTDLYHDAHDLASKWFHAKGRYDDLASVEILSLESKNYFMLPSSKGDLKVNYIMDRLDRVSPGEYRVVDYKSNRVALTENQLRGKLQAKLYALMVQIKYKDAQRIWVQFDFFRHRPVEVLFTRDDNVKMYRELRRRAEDILATDENQVKETLNDECGYCVRKSSCETLLRHVAAGGILGKTPEELAEIHYDLQSAEKASKILLAEVEDALLKYCIENDTMEFETPSGIVSVVGKQRREVNHSAAAAVLGPLAGEYQRFSVTDIDRIIKQGVVSGPQADLLRASIIKKTSEPTIKVDHSGY